MLRSARAGGRSPAPRRSGGERAAAILAVAALAGGVGSALAAEDREVRWTSGDVELAGVLLQPPGDAPWPAAVIVHGSGDSDRTNAWARTFAELLVDEGLAVLLPDKRGSGASGGDWREADFQELASDALAGVERLRASPGVDGRRIGLVGLSQGGHVVSLAGARDPSLAFVVNVAGGATTMAETVAWEVEQAWRETGAPEEGVALGLELLRVSDDVARGTGDWNRYLDVRRRVEATYGSRAVATFPDSPEAPYWAWWGRIVDFDPMLRWPRVEAPVLFLYGSDDRNQPTAESARRVETLVEAAGADVTLRVFDGAGHSLRSPGGALREDVREALSGWLDRVLRP